MKLRNPFVRAAPVARVRKEPTIRMVRRGYEGAEGGRLTESWIGTNQSADRDIFRALRQIRARSRDLFINNSYAKHLGHMVKTNVIGPNGFKFQVRGMDPNGTADTAANTAIEKAFKKWCKRGVCEITHRMSFTTLQQTMIQAVARDGECLVRKLFGGAAENDFGFALQLLDIDRLDHDLNREFKDGAIIKMGVELNPAGRPVAYHLLRKHPGDGVYGMPNGRLYERVPAREIYHIFVADRPEQTRGVPWMHAAMVNLHNLAKYDEAALIAARVGASKMGFYKQPPDGDAGAVVDGAQTDKDSGDVVELLTDAEPGHFQLLPDGYDFASFNPDYPHANYDPFTKAAVRGASVGLNVSYPMFSNDLGGVNFSSIRAGVLADRDEWMVLQGFHAESFLEDLGPNWLRMAMLFRQIELLSGAVLSSLRFDKFAGAISWMGRRWAWVDPLKDQKANSSARADLMKSRRQIMASNGDDIEDVWREIAREKELAAELGIDLPDSAVQDLTAPDPDDSPEDDEVIPAVAPAAK